MNIELLDSAKDNGRKVIPFNTGKIAIGSAYQPKPKQSDAQWIEKHRAPGYGGLWWTCVCAIAVVSALVIVRAA